MDWFAEWFDTPYYHILYKNRNDEEAKRFITHLLNFLKLPKDSKILDLACGKGRHSIFLNELGYNVKGIDLSKNSIKNAKEYEKENLEFLVGDMREVHFPNEFDAIFNLFTSFGYFNDDEDNVKTYQAIYDQLNDSGVFVMDFMNVDNVSGKLIPNEVKTIENIDFHLERKIENNFIIKDIYFKDKDKDFHYQERVKVCGLDYFKKLAEKVGFKFINVFGDYNLNSFNLTESPRLILILKK